MRYDLEVDYSQFQLNGVRWIVDDELLHTANSPGLLYADVEPNYIALTVFREYGPVPVELEILAAEPEPLGPAWQDVLEFSVTAEEEPTLGGWAERGEEINLTPETEYRVRYAVSDAEKSDRVSAPPYPERYRIDIWPAPLSAGRVIASSSAR